MDPDSDPDPAIFVIDLQDANKNKLIYNFSVYYFFKVHVHNFKDKKSKRNHKTVGIKVFLRYYFCLMKEGSGSGSLKVLSNDTGGGGCEWYQWIGH